MENMMSSFRCEVLKNGNSRHLRAFNAIARRAILLGSAAIFPLIFAQSAQAQVCTAEVLADSASSFEGRDASGNPGGFDTSRLEVGDFIVYEDTVIAGYNPAAAIDVVFEVTGINLNSAVPPNSVPSDRVEISPGGSIQLQDSQSRSDPFITYRLIPMRAGSVTSTVASGTPVSLLNTEVSLQDVDSISRQDTSDVAGFLNSNPGNFTVRTTDTIPFDFQNGGGPANFTTYTQPPVSTIPVSWDGALAGDFLDHTVDISYPVFTDGQFLHGLTGFSSRSNNRGAVIALCGEIAEPELTTLKTLNSVTPNSDGTTDVSYTISIENTGDQTLTGLNLSDDLDDVFSGAYDAFTPSTAADTSGGVIAQDATATIVTDNGDPIGSFATNTSFNGGSDINLFNPSNSISMDPDDEISLTFVIKLNPNVTGNDVSFVNDITVSMTDEFLLPATSTTTSAPVVVQTPGIEAVDNDFSATPVPPGAGGVTASVFENDTLNGADFAPADVSVSITDDGRLYDLTINADGTINVPTGTVPGIYQVEYEICDVNDPTNCDTAIATIAVQTTTADVLVLPQQCGGWTTQGWLTFGPKINDVNVMFSSGNYVDDPYLYEPIERDAQGRILSFMGTPDETGAGAIPDRPGSNLITTPQADPAHMSEYHRFVHRLGGAPNSSETITYNTVAAAEFTAYWIEDNAGNVLDSSDFRYTRALNGPGESFPITINYPADGEVFLHSAIFDPTAGYGSPVLEDYECPEPSLSMEKVADNPGPYLVGDVVTYTYTVTNDGNVAIRNVAITDTHNGSDPAPIPGNETLLTDVAPTGDSTDAAINNSWDVLAAGDTLTFTGTYKITQTDAENL